MDGNKRPRALAIGNVYYQAEPVNPNRAIDIRIIENRQSTGESKSDPREGRHHYSVAEPVRLTARFSPGPATSDRERECLPGLQEDVYEEAVAVVLQPGEDSLNQQGSVGHKDRAPAQRGVRQQQDGHQYPGCRWMACSSRQLCAIVVLVTLIVIGTTLLVALTTLLHQTQTPPRSSWTTVTISPTEQNTTPTSAITGKTSFPPHVTLPRTTATPEEETPSRAPFRTAWVPKGHNARVVEEMRILGRIGGSEPGQFQNPRGVVVSAENEIFVADRFNHQIQVFDMEGALLRMFPTVMPDPHGFMVAPVDPVTPEDVSLDGRGNLWVVGKHATGNVAVRYARDGYPRGKIHLTMTAFTRGIAVNPKRGRVLVTEADGRVGEVLMFRPDGLLERRFGRQEGMLHPWYVATDTREGNILVSDYDTNYVYMYDHWGGFLAKFGGHFRHPDGLCVDVHGNIIVADQGNRRVEVLTSRGEHVRYVGRGLGKPSGVAVAPTGQLVVTYGLRSIVVIFTH